jgi:phosphate starvation-inducible PhoH-like protein
MTEKTIHFDNASEAAELTGTRCEILATVEEALGVHMVSRDTWICVEGEAENVDAADRFFQCLRKARNRGAYRPEHSVPFTLKALQRGQEDEIDRLLDTGIEVGHGKPSVFPRTFGQCAYVHKIMENDIVLGIGPAGTGKTYLAMAMAVSSLLEERVGRIILTRPAVEAGEALGYLPGDMYQKVMPYLRPLYDALYDMLDANLVQKFLDQGVIEVAPLAYMRGRTLNNSFIILDEAQNTTPEQMLMFLTRLGFDSKCVVTGDITQIDLPSKKNSGLLEARGTLDRIPGIGLAELTEEDVVRHQLVQKIIKAYRNARSDSIEPDASPVMLPDRSPAWNVK